jgi:hypothetical protein
MAWMDYIPLARNDAGKQLKPTSRLPAAIVAAGPPHLHT